MNYLTQLIEWANVPANALGSFFLFPIGILPGWLSNTIISMIVGIILLVIFKYTTNQNAIGRIRDNIKANMLALTLFKDSLKAAIQAQGRILIGAMSLLIHSLRPMGVFAVPVCLLLSQMALWYPYQPLIPGDEVIVTMRLNREVNPPLPLIALKSLPAAEITMGPIRVLSKNEVLWKIKARKSGYHSILFELDNQKIEKELAVGNGFMRVSVKRPGWHWMDILSHPWEKPFRSDSLVQSISIDYPKRISRASGTGWWIFYFFMVSMASAFIFKPFLKVKI